MLFTDPLLVDRLAGLSAQWLYKILINMCWVVIVCEKIT